MTRIVTLGLEVGFGVGLFILVAFGIALVGWTRDSNK
jgi:hypothetical protein